MNKFITLSAVLLLSGCSTYQWVKPGSNANDAAIAETKCEAQALRDLPPDNVVSSTYTTKDKKIKRLIRAIRFLTQMSQSAKC